MTLPSTRWFSCGAALLFTGATLAGACAQTSDAPAPARRIPEYEVVSIRPNTSGDGRMRMNSTADGITATNFGLRLLISIAYRFNDKRISGVPSLDDGTRYDVQAKVSDADLETYKNLTQAERSVMLQHALEERFHLKVHRETKDAPVFNLVIAKGGLKMKEATPGDTYPNGFHGPDGKAGGAGMMRMMPGQLIGQAIAVGGLVDLITRDVDRPILDKTGLTGKYDITLKWTPEHGPGMIAGPGGPPPPPSADDAGLSIYTALEEQLGLKLEAARGPVETLVVDHVESPSEN
jgi:uncharacterized protein (TIGR03435 family)